jgi:SAM-dependent methyltransferase
VLDVGCGPAVMEAQLLERGFEVIGIDVSEEMIRHGSRRIAHHPLQARCRLRVGDVEALEFPDGFFDAVVAMGVLEYLPDYSRALAELHRVLKPGGMALLTVPSRISPYRLARSGYERLKRVLRSGRPQGFVPNRCLPWRLDAELAHAGFLKRESRGCNFIVFPLHELCPGASAGLDRALSFLSSLPAGAWIGTQYIVKAERRAPYGTNACGDPRWC